MTRRLPILVAVALGASLLMTPFPALAARKKKAPPKRTARKAPAKRSAAARPPQLYGPPAPTPVPWLRAAGACAGYEPGRYLILAEVGGQGRVFWIDGETETELRRLGPGDRVRVLWMPGPDGPVARKLLAGPTSSPAP